MLDGVFYRHRHLHRQRIAPEGLDFDVDSRLGMLGEIAERCEEIGDNYLSRLKWFVDEAMPLLCYDDENLVLNMKSC